MIEVKFCGMTREADAAFAAAAGATYIGVIFAGGPREVAVEAAGRILGGAGPGVKRVGVFGADYRERIPRVESIVALDVVQLHADPTLDDLRAARRIFRGVIWTAVRVGGAILPGHADALFAEADGVLLDPRVAGKLGGTGQVLPLRDLAPAVEKARKGAVARLVLAGGLTAENVSEAIEILPPDVVDVSSGVESAPGIKDHAKIGAFANAVRRSNR
jgi:phosphoribosylanthranilate isomerase